MRNYKNTINILLTILVVSLVILMNLLLFVINTIKQRENQLPEVIRPSNNNENYKPQEEKLEFDLNVDYNSLIVKCSEENTDESFKRAQEYERLGNLKAEYFNGSEYSIISYLSECSSWEEFFNNDEALEFFGIIVEGTYSLDIDYKSLIEEGLKDPLNNSFSEMKEYERLENLKIDDLCLDTSLKTNYFTNYNSWNELFLSGTMDSYFIEKNYRYIVANTDYVNLRSGPSTSYKKVIRLHFDSLVNYLGIIINEDFEIWYKVSYNGKIGYIHNDYLSIFNPTFEAYNYTEDDVYWLAVAITMEAGSEWIPEWVRNYTGCVVLNRVESELYPNTIYEVLHQKGQYSWASRYYKKPYDWCVETAKDLLNGNRLLPSDIIYQANFTQGEYVYATYYDSKLNSTLYFCGE